MIKKERRRLFDEATRLFSKFGIKITESKSEEGELFGLSITGEARGAFGSVAIRFQGPCGSREKPWMPCRLNDYDSTNWPAVYWNGFDHWKQNLDLSNAETVEDCIDAMRSHLRHLGIEELHPASC